MAVDEAILDSVENDRSLPCLRLYAWQPPCLSIGYAQPFLDIDRDRLSSRGWEWVRRPTGGRAILHTDELTYSAIAPSANPVVSGSVLDSYQRLSNALLYALGSLNIPAMIHPSNQVSRNQRNDAVCFEVPSNYEIVVAGKKLIGSAQARRKKGVLQHGTLPLHGDLTRITSVLSYPDETARAEASTRLLSHATTAEIILGYKVDWQDAAQAFISGFQEELNINFIQDELSREEISASEVLMNQKYSNPAWLERT